MENYLMLNGKRIDLRAVDMMRYVYDVYLDSLNTAELRELGLHRDDPGPKGHSGVLQIVYCEDCKNRAKGQDRDYTVYCERFRQMMDNTDFCSYGERENDG